VTITGPGGAGKTRLALAVAASMVKGLPDRAVCVPLAPVRDPAFVPAAIAQALGLPDTRRLSAALEDRELLLVLDNVEHQLAAAPVIADLADACPRLRVFCTSRVRLGLSGEHVHPLPGLLPEDSAPVRAASASAGSRLRPHREPLVAGHDLPPFFIRCQSACLRRSCQARSIPLSGDREGRRRNGDRPPANRARALDGWE
jgi:hypothetical protein